MSITETHVKPIDSNQQHSLAGECPQFVKELPIPAEAKKRLLALTPATYTGLAARLARDVG